MKRLGRRITLAHVTRALLYSAVLVVLGVAFTTSFKSGASGAQALGYAPEFKASLPLVCDVVAAVATFMHAMARNDKPMRRTATWFVLVPMILSWVANAIDHVARAEVGPAEWTLAVVALAGLCPVAVAALLYLSTKFHEFEQRQAEKATEVRQRAERRAETAAKPRKQPPAKRQPTEAEHASNPEVPSLEQPRNRRAAGIEYAKSRWPDVSGGQIAKEIGVSRAEGDRIRAMVKQEMEAS